MIKYETVYDISRVADSWTPGLFSVLLLFAALLFLVLLWKTRANGKVIFVNLSMHQQSIALGVLAAVCLANAIFTTLGDHSDSRDLGMKMGRGQFPVVEGLVTNYRSNVPKGYESFSVANKNFTYSFYIDGPGFHLPSAFNGPIKEGRHVRITYDGNVILKVEIA